MLKPRLMLIYRACPLEHGVSPVKRYRPNGFCKIKNFVSIWEKHKSDNFFDIDIHLIFDGEKSENFLSKFEIESTSYTTSRGNSNSYQQCLDFANKNIDDADLIYFVEDDYYHKPNWTKILYDGYLISHSSTIFSLYDHPDRYTRNDDIGPKDIFAGNFCHWRSAESTTCTWAIKPDGYKDIYLEAKKFSIADRDFFRNGITQSKYFLITPIPAMSTHLHLPYISPYFNLDTVYSMKKIKAYIAGPMRGMYRYNYAGFSRVEKLLTDHGIEAINPHTLDKEQTKFDITALPDNTDWEKLPANLDLKDVVKRDLSALIECDIIVMLNNWQYSIGALAEENVARWANIPRTFEADIDINIKNNTLHEYLRSLYGSKV